MGRSWTTEVGHSTKAVPGGDLPDRVAAAVAMGGNVIELSVADDGLLDTVGSARGLARSTFRRVSVHAPAGMAGITEDELVGRLASFDVPVVADAASITTPELWRRLGSRLLIENGDEPDAAGRTPAELADVFAALPEARFCLDLSHALRAGGPALVGELTAAFRTRLDELHVGCSGDDRVDSRLEPDLLDAISAVVSIVGRPVPVVIERLASRPAVLSDVYAVRVALVNGVERAAAA